MASIQLRDRRGDLRGVAVLDDADAGQCEHRWYLSNRGRAARNVPHTGRQRQVLLHREILGLVHGDGVEVDHWDGDKLNNHRDNLRIVPHSRNAQNVPARGGTSAHRGVSWKAANQKWQAAVRVAGVTHYLGLFADELEAARVAGEFRLLHMPHTNESRSVVDLAGKAIHEYRKVRR